MVPLAHNEGHVFVEGCKNVHSVSTRLSGERFKKMRVLMWISTSLFISSERKRFKNARPRRTKFNSLTTTTTPPRSVLFPAVGQRPPQDETKQWRIQNLPLMGGTGNISCQNMAETSKSRLVTPHIKLIRV